MKTVSFVYLLLNLFLYILYMKEFQLRSCILCYYILLLFLNTVESSKTKTVSFV